MVQGPKGPRLSSQQIPSARLNMDARQVCFESSQEVVRGGGLEPPKAFAIGASVLLLRPNSDIPACPSIGGMTCYKHILLAHPDEAKHHESIRRRFADSPGDNHSYR